MRKKTQSKEMKALRALKKLKNYRAMAYAGSEMYTGSSGQNYGGGGGSINEVVTTAQPIPAQTYDTSAGAFTSPGTSYGGPTSGSSGTSYGTGVGGGGTVVTTGKVEDTAEGIEEEEVEVKETEITDADLVKSESGLYLVRDTYVNEEGDTVAAEYSIHPEHGKTQAQLDATDRAQEYKNNLAAAEAADYAEQRRLTDAENKISPEDNADVQEVVNTMANTGDNAVHPRDQDGPVDSTGSGTVTEGSTGAVNTNTAGAPTDIEQTNPTYVAPKMEAASTLKAVPEIDQRADAYAAANPEWDETQSAEAKAWFKKAQENTTIGIPQPEMPAWLGSSNFLKGFDEALALEIDESKTVAPEGTTTDVRNIEKLDDAGTTYAGTVDAPASVGYSSQKAPTKVKQPTGMEGETYTAAQAGYGTDVTNAVGTVSEDAQAKLDDAKLTERAKAAERDKAEEKKAEAAVEEFVISDGAYVNKVTGEVATVVQAKDAEAAQREAITGEPTPKGEAAEIMSMYEFNQLEKRAISKDNAIKNLKSQGLSDKEIAKRLADNPQLIADEFDDLPEDIKTTLSGLPQEALVSVQMETLMAGMEDGEIPAWARPALAKVESNLAMRGMSSSSIGRDALFNAIIQSAIPMAQSNAQAVQNATSQDKQIAADFLAKNAGFKQQMDLANMSNDQQMRLANLSALNQASSENMNARQQTELANLNNRMQTNLLQGKIAADMGIAQLNADQQRAVQNASMVANVDMTKFNSAQQVELTNSKFMQSMVATKFSADQQAAMQNATAMATMDMANLDKNAKIAVQNAQAFLQMDMTNLSNEQQSNVMKAQNQQQVLLSDTAARNAALQFGAANEQQVQQFMASLGVQVEQYNSSSNAAREQFNATAKDRAAAIDAGNELQAASLQAQMDTDIAKFNEQQDFQRDQWNASNAQAVEQSNVQWRRQANLADTAAQNSANQQNAQIAYNLTSQEQTQLWQQLRDEAAYIRQNFENEQQRKAQMLATAIGNEKVFKSDNTTKVSDLLRTLDSAIG